MEDKGYKLKLTDFKPITGVVNYDSKRFNHLVKSFKEDFSWNNVKVQAKYFGNENLLIAYNLVVLGLATITAYASINGLEKLVE